MDKKSRLYFLYVGAVLVAGSVFAFFSGSATDNKDIGVVRILSTTTSARIAVTTDTTSSRKTTAAKTTSTKAASTTVTEAEETTVPVVLWFDINEAGAEQLALLPGIGEKLAGEIVNYRSANGGFRNIEELMKVSGIGESKFVAVRDYIYVIDPVYDEDVPGTAYEPKEEPQVQEETVHIPTLEEIAPIDLNTASKEELMLLPYVDETIAERIISFREQAGGFSHPYELLYIEGLNRDKTALIVGYVKVNDEPS